MKIKTIEIDNYKTFYGNQNTIEVDSKNLFIYGENGSGKSSLYYALKDFVQGSIETIDLDQVENIFIPTAEKGKVKVKLTFNPDSTGANANQVIELSSTANPHNDGDIRDTNKLRSFLNYKHLLGIHNIKKDEEIDLFDLLVRGVLREFKPIGMRKSLGETWTEIEELLERPTGLSYNSQRKRNDLGTLIGEFNAGFEPLFTAPTSTSPSPDYILEKANPILQQFDRDIKIKLTYNRAALDAHQEKINGGKVKIEIEYGGKLIDKPHMFLNEARLSAIAISIYLGMIKRLPQGQKFKILFLDDLFIGLDLSNRMPLLDILKQDFADYQIIISTYDRPWYELVKFQLEDDTNWKCLEILARKNQRGYDQPLIKQSGNSFITKAMDTANEYYRKGDNKAAGVYLRAAFEFILKHYCEKKKLRVKYLNDRSKLTTEDFWVAIIDFKKNDDDKAARSGGTYTKKCQLEDSTVENIELYRKFVLNPLCHIDLDKHETTAEIERAITAIEALKTELG
jgi:energy-coupling factor transporter ATP-binding protein EcfA2